MADRQPDPTDQILRILRKLRLIEEHLHLFRDPARLEVELGRLLAEAGIDTGRAGFDLRSYLYLVLPSYLLDQPVTELPGLSPRTAKLLQDRIIETLEDLLEHSKEELLRQRGFGPEALAEVNAFMADYEDVTLHLSPHDERLPEPPPGDDWVRMSAGTEHERWVLRSRLTRAAVFDLEETPYPDYRILRHLGQKLRIVRVGQLLTTGRAALLAADWSDIKLTIAYIGESDADPAQYAAERLEYLLSRYGLSFPEA